MYICISLRTNTELKILHCTCAVLAKSEKYYTVLPWTFLDFFQGDQERGVEGRRKFRVSFGGLRACCLLSEPLHSMKLILGGHCCTSCDSFTSCINIPFLCRHSILNSLSLILKRNKLVLWPSMSSFKLRSLKETFIYWEHLSLASQSLQNSYPGSLISPPSRSEERGEERAGRWETLGTRLNLSQLWITTMPVKLTWVLLRKHASEIILLAMASDNIYDAPVQFSPLISWVTKRSLGGTAPIPSGVMVKNDHGWQITS